MALQTSGAISLNDIHVEVGGTSGTLVSANDADVRGLTSVVSGASSTFSSFYGASNAHTITVGAYGTGSGVNKSYGYTSSNYSMPPWGIYSQSAANMGASSETLAPGGQEIRGIIFSGHVGFKADFARFIFTVAGNFAGSPTSVFNSITITSNSGIWAGPFSSATVGVALQDANQTAWAYQFSSASSIPNASGLGWTAGSTQTIVIT